MCYRTPCNILLRFHSISFSITALPGKCRNTKDENSWQSSISKLSPFFSFLSVTPLKNSHWLRMAIRKPILMTRISKIWIVCQLWLQGLLHHHQVHQVLNRLIQFESGHIMEHHQVSILVGVILLNLRAIQL